MCTKNLHVDIWSWVIGHGELESGVYFDRGGPVSGFFVAPYHRAAQRQRPAPCLVRCSLKRPSTATFDLRGPREEP